MHLHILLFVTLLTAAASKSLPLHKNKHQRTETKNTNALVSLRGGALPDYRYFLAGGICAAVSHGITTPVDVVKTRMQSDPTLRKLSVMKAAKQLIDGEGVAVLGTGLVPTIVGYGVEGAMKFGCYEVFKPVILKYVISGKAQAYMISSVIAGAIASVLLCPAESARIRQVSQPNYCPSGSSWETLRMLVDESGFASLFDGLAAMLAKQVPYTMTKQVVFDLLAGVLYEVVRGMSGGEDKAWTKWVVSFTAAAGAAFLACISSQPGDMILTQTYKNAGKANFVNVVKDIYSDGGGMKGFFAGTQARLVHVGIIITSQLMIYDAVKQAIGLKPTGQ